MDQNVKVTEETLDNIRHCAERVLDEASRLIEAIESTPYYPLEVSTASHRAKADKARAEAVLAWIATIGRPVPPSTRG